MPDSIDLARHIASRLMSIESSTMPGVHPDRVEFQRMKPLRGDEIHQRYESIYTANEESLAVFIEMAMDGFEDA